MPLTGGGIIDLTLPEKEWEEFFFYHVCLQGILSLAWLMRSRGVSRGWRERIHKSLPLLRGVSFHAPTSICRGKSAIGWHGALPGVERL
jgi:hypothetical protein